MPQNTQDILKGFQPNGDWRSKLRSIRTAVENYDNLAGADRQAGEIQHVRPILPTYWDVFHTHNIARRRQGLLPDSCYDVGVFLVGFSSIPIVLSLAEIQPCKKIYFLYSDGTDYIVAEIEDRIKVMLGCGHPLIRLVTAADLKEIDKPSDPVATFKQIKGIIDKVGDKRIALDLTGGKKTMIGGGFTAGAILGPANNIDMFYVDSLEYDPRRGAPKPGTEFLSLLENPYDVYNVQSVQEAEKLFKEHNYKAAADLWGGIKEKLEPHYRQFNLKEEYNEAVNHYRRADCYHLWDAFYYDLAKNSKNRHKNSWGYDQKHTRCSIDVLDILSAVHDRITLFNDPAHIIHYAVDRYQNAIRRKKSGKLEDAIVRFTQVIEMLCVYQIYRIVINDNLVKECGNPITSLEFWDEHWRVTPLIRLLFGGPNCLPHPRWHYDRDKRYTIKCDTERLIIVDYSPISSVGEITDLIEFRNEFIHVTSAMTRSQTEQNVQKLQKLALRFLANFSKNYREEQCLSFKSLLKLHRFRR